MAQLQRKDKKKTDVQATATATNVAAAEKKATTQKSKKVEKAPQKATPALTKSAATAKKATSVKKAPSTRSTASDITIPVGMKPVSRPFGAITEEDIRLAFDAAIQEADAQILRNTAKAVGKYEFALEVDGFHFYLIANNGQILFDSPSFTSLIGAINGIKTFQKTVAEGDFQIKGDKYNRYRFILARKYYGENYTTRDQCVKCAESVKKFANNAKIIRYTPEREAIRAYEYAKTCKRTPDDIDWKAVARAEEQASKLGKFEICCEDKQYCYYLLANNGQILYSSRYYASEKACRQGIDSFKRAAYVGNFFVDRDKFGHYRYILKNIGSAPNFLGESYDNKPQCEKIIESVKKFIVSASIELEQPGEE